MKAHELIHRGLYILGESKIVYFYALNGKFYSLDKRCIGMAIQDQETGEVECWGAGSDWRKVKPIPLTAEILEKNGFVLRGKTYILQYHGAEIRWRKTDGYTSITAPSNLKNLGQSSISNGRFGYVHIFQHALRLCEMNDLADNFKV